MEIDYDYDDVITFCAGAAQVSIIDLANNLNILSYLLASCEDSFHSMSGDQVIYLIYKGFSDIIGSSSTNTGVSGLNSYAAQIINVCYSEAIYDKQALGVEDITLTPTERFNTPEESGELQNYRTVVASPGTCTPYSATPYNLEPEEFQKFCATIYAEAVEGNEFCYSDTMGVASVMLNRLESGHYNNITEVLSAKGQFSGYGYGNQKFSAAMNDPNVISSEMMQAIKDTLAGNRNTNGTSFSGRGTHNVFR